MGNRNLKPCKQCGVLPELMYSHGFRFGMDGMVYKYFCPRCGRNTKPCRGELAALAEWNKENKEERQ